jgi:alkanesulfonate monooxygenase SsuD/methylene tetrahydromethanopterin reductase-like flavin-dependent oxidoreductase (luciferase family)
MKNRLGKLNPGPVGTMPILIGGSGEKVTLRLVAEHADSWNTFGPPENFQRLNGILDDWCAKVGRDPGEIERTVGVSTDDVHDIGRYVEAGATHAIVMISEPFDLTPLESLLAQRDALGSSSEVIRSKYSSNR